MPEFAYTDLLPLGEDTTPYRLVTAEGVSTFEADGRTFLKVEPEALRKLAAEAMHDISHYLRPAHLAQLRRILDDPEASANDQFVALDLLKNANIAAAGVLPMCQDTGTAIVMGKRGQNVLTEGGDEEALSRGIYDAYTKLNLRYSQMAPLTMWEEKNTGSNLPAQIELYATDGGAYKFLFMAKGGGSANKSFLYQETKAVLNEASMMKFLEEKIRSLGTAACPPYHLAIVVGGTSRRVRAEDREVRLRALPGRAARRGLPDRPRLPRQGAGGEGLRADAEDRHRRAVRRQVLLPRRARRPAAPARRLAARRDRRVLLGRPPGHREDHRRGRLPGAAGDRPGALPAGDDGRAPGRGGGRRDASTSTGRWTRSSPS